MYTTKSILNLSVLHLFGQELHESLRIIGADKQRVDDAAVGVAQITARLEAAALSDVLSALATETAQTYIFEAAVILIGGVQTLRSLFDGELHSALTAALAHFTAAARTRIEEFDGSTARQSKAKEARL